MDALPGVGGERSPDVRPSAGPGSPLVLGLYARAVSPFEHTKRRAKGVGGSSGEKNENVGFGRKEKKGKLRGDGPKTRRDVASSASRDHLRRLRALTVFR